MPGRSNVSMVTLKIGFNRLEITGSIWFTEHIWKRCQRYYVFLNVDHWAWDHSHICNHERRWRIIQDLTLSAWRELPTGVESENKEHITFGEPESPERSRAQSASHLRRSSIQDDWWLIRNHDVDNGAHATFITEAGVKRVGAVCERTRMTGRLRSTSILNVVQSVVRIRIQSSGVWFN